MPAGPTPTVRFGAAPGRTARFASIRRLGRVPTGTRDALGGGGRARRSPAIRLRLGSSGGPADRCVEVGAEPAKSGWSLQARRTRPEPLRGATAAAGRRPAVRTAPVGTSRRRARRWCQPQLPGRCDRQRSARPPCARRRRIVDVVGPRHRPACARSSVGLAARAGSEPEGRRRRHVAIMPRGLTV